jgi:quercetin dioxygenase-like cupin family protein
VYDIAADAATFGASSVEGPALVWELHDAAPVHDVLLSAEVTLDPDQDWLVRCDRIDFPPGGIAHLHTHPGPGIRCTLFGALTVLTKGETGTYGPLAAWFETGPDPVYAVAAEDGDAAFVRVMLLPREWEGRRTIRYVDPADADKPKRQRATVFFDHPIEL